MRRDAVQTEGSVQWWADFKRDTPVPKAMVRAPYTRQFIICCSFETHFETAHRELGFACTANAGVLRQKSKRCIEIEICDDHGESMHLIALLAFLVGIHELPLREPLLKGNTVLTLDN